MVQAGHDGLQRIADGEKIDDALVFIEWAVYFGGHAVRVPMQPLARPALQRDKVRGAEHQIVVGNANVKGVHIHRRS